MLRGNFSAWRQLAQLARRAVLALHDLATWGLHPSSPYARSAILRRNRIERGGL